MSAFCQEENEEVKMARWDLYFRRTEVETKSGRPDGHKFGRYFATDGISISVKMTRLVVRSSEWLLTSVVLPYTQWRQHCCHALCEMNITQIEPGEVAVPRHPTYCTVLYCELKLIFECVYFQADREAPDDYLLQQEWFQQCALPDMRVVGIDPGVIDFVTGAVAGDVRHAKNTFR